MRKRETAGWRQSIQRGEFWTEADAREALAEWEQSGESVVGFARRNGVEPKRLYWWRHQLKKGSKVVRSAPVAPLIPVTVRVAESPARWLESIVIVDGDLRIEVGDAKRVAPEWVAELLRRVREGRE
jgi:transposase-like protein